MVGFGGSQHEAPSPASAAPYQCTSGRPIATSAKTKAAGSNAALAYSKATRR